MITLHFHLQPQYKCELFHIHVNFTSFHCTGRYELNKLTSLPMCGVIAQTVEHRTGIAEVTGSNPVEALNFFRLLLSNCLNWKIYCDDHISLSMHYVLHLLELISYSWMESTCLHILSFPSFTTVTAVRSCDIRDGKVCTSVVAKSQKAKFKIVIYFC